MFAGSVTHKSGMTQWEGKAGNVKEGKETGAGTPCYWTLMRVYSPYIAGMGSKGSSQLCLPCRNSRVSLLPGGPFTIIHSSVEKLLQ